MSRGELERLKWGPEPGQVLGGLGSVRIVADCPGNAERVLRRAKEVLEPVFCVTDVSRQTPQQWAESLPRWFLQQFAPEPTKEVKARYLALPVEERMQRENSPWTLASWLYWLQPANRYWSWWDAAVTDDKTLIVALEVAEWPFPWEALKWVFEAAGATSISSER